MEWKLIVAGLALMWGSEKEMTAMAKCLTDNGGQAKAEKCTQQDIDTICNRGLL